MKKKEKKHARGGVLRPLKTTFGGDYSTLRKKEKSEDYFHRKKKKGE